MHVHRAVMASGRRVAAAAKQEKEIIIQDTLTQVGPPLKILAGSVSACKQSVSKNLECFNCGVDASDRSDLSLKTCSRCKLVFYCSESCQRQHWKKGEHRRFCIAVGDRKTYNGIADINATKPIEMGPTSLSQPLSEGIVSSAECAVCLEPLNKSINCTLPCNHVFHHDCMTGVQSFGLSQKCPLCRSSFPTLT